MARTRDIEDVLSAIRRLVADEDAADRSAPGGPTLLLSSAQRVGGSDTASFPALAGDDTIRDGTEKTPNPFRPDAPATDEAHRAPGAETTPKDQFASTRPRSAEERDPSGNAPKDAASETPAPAATDTAAPETSSERPESPADDARLRALVADVLRQELSGELGERITANIRELVRGEIRQILASSAPD